MACSKTEPEGVERGGDVYAGREPGRPSGSDMKKRCFSSPTVKPLARPRGRRAGRRSRRDRRGEAASSDLPTGASRVRVRTTLTSNPDWLRAPSPFEPSPVGGAIFTRRRSSRACVFPQTDRGRECYDRRNVIVAVTFVFRRFL